MTAPTIGPVDNAVMPAPAAQILRRDSTRPVWEEEPTKAGQSLKGLTLTVVCALILGPLWVVIVTSLSDQKTITDAGGLVIFPKSITFNAYTEILSGGVVTRAVMVSLGLTLVGTAISMAVSILAAYGLSRPGSFAHRPLLLTLLITMFFGAGLIPTYLLISGMGLIDSYWALILPSAVSAFNILVLRSFFMSTAPELIDSARIDGAGEWRILLQIVLPLSRAVTAVIALFYAVGYWSSWFNAMLYINSPEKWPLQLILRYYVLMHQSFPGSGTNNGIMTVGANQVPGLAVQMAVMVLALIPVAIIYPFVQKHFQKGMLIGAVKG